MASLQTLRISAPWCKSSWTTGLLLSHLTTRRMTVLIVLLPNWLTHWKRWTTWRAALSPKRGRWFSFAIAWVDWSRVRLSALTVAIGLSGRFWLLQRRMTRRSQTASLSAASSRGVSITPAWRMAATHLLAARPFNWPCKMGTNRFSSSFLRLNQSCQMFSSWAYRAARICWSSVRISSAISSLMPSSSGS